MSDADRQRTAYHESGHALVGMLTPGADPVRKISIIPRGQALGVTLSTPEADRYNYSRDDLIAKIKVSLGGRAAEKVIYDEITTGAESDIQQLTKIARGMVGRWGMSDAIGPLALGEGREDGQMLPGGSPVSPATQQTVDEEARRIVETAEQEVIELLEREQPRLDALADALLERETLDQPEAYELAGVASEDGAYATGTREERRPCVRSSQRRWRASRTPSPARARASTAVSASSTGREPALVERVDVGLEVEHDGVAGWDGLDLQQRGAARADVFANVHPVRVAAHQRGIDLVDRLLAVAHVHERCELPVAAVVAELVPAVAFGDAPAVGLLDDVQVLGVGQPGSGPPTGRRPVRSPASR